MLVSMLRTLYRFAIPHAVAAESGGCSGTITAQEALAAEAARYAAQMSNDFAAMERMFGDDLVYIHSSTTLDTKASFIDRVHPKPLQTQQQQHSVAKQSIAPSNLNSFPRIQPQPTFGTLMSPRGEKPYVYKPKEPTQSNALWSVDAQALSNQREFIAEGHRHPSHPRLGH